MKLRLWGAISAGILAFLSPLTHAALIDNGGGLIYDDVLDITWAQPDTTRNWDDAKTWAAGLTLGGVSSWRLPYISVAAEDGPYTGSPVFCSIATELACRDNEMGYMFYQNLSGTDGQPILDSGDPDLTLFPSLQSLLYWTGTEYLDPISAWIFDFSLGGGGGSEGINTERYTWAVHDGNISPSAIPVPAAAWLFGSGLLGLVGIARPKKA